MVCFSKSWKNSLMKPASAKQKGRVGQKAANSIFLNAAHKFSLLLNEDDFISRSSGSNGEDCIFSPLARKIYPISVESKNIKAFRGKNFYLQAASNAGNYEPVVTIKLPRDAMLLSIIATQALAELYAENAYLKDQLSRRDIK